MGKIVGLEKFNKTQLNDLMYHAPQQAKPAKYHRLSKEEIYWEIVKIARVDEGFANFGQQMSNKINKYID